MSSPHSNRRLESPEGLISVDPGDGKKIVPSKTIDYINLVTSGAETRTLPDPVFEGIELTLNLKDDGGNCVVTASTAINATGNTVMTFADESDVIVLKSVNKGGSYVWRVVGNDGVALS
ncbi:hypothetical protein [Bremerella sp. P1]|uniref:hypothetical protein n=1 Tax=Bremerella sp. P1 TaxID=3026424 RepID=UPI00236753E8|nr:hypothetical protein [Bremerella sp. P1]WDI44772.1 hypothetical protein PSR63_12580 [Bremerella sp. P1]